MAQTAEKTAVADKPVKPKHAPVSKRVFTPLRIALIVAVGVIAIAFTAVSVYALTYGFVYPNISAYGVPLDGMTEEEAAAALASKLEAVYDGTSVSLSLDGQSLTVTAEDAGIVLSTDATARAAIDAGREGSVFTRLAFAFSSLYTQRNVEKASDLYIDEEAVRGIVLPFGESLAVSPVEYDWTVGNKSIAVTGGVPGRRTDPEKMAADVINSFKEQNFALLSYNSEIIEPVPFPLEDIYNEIHVDPVSASVVLDENRQPKLVRHTVGVSFDKNAAKAALAGSSPGVSIPLLYTAPDVTAEKLEKNLFRDMLGEYTTSTAGSSSNRVGNIIQTTVYISGMILLPGDRFSFNDVVGRRTEERGFKPAGAYINGELTDDVGGGICQSSTTLYNAAMLSNLKIVSRQCHSMTIAYVPRGRDATVDYGNIDFAFENDTGYPVRIEMSHTGNKLNCQIWGTKTDDLTVEIEDELISYTAMEKLTVVNPDLPPGARQTKQTGHNGLVVQTYRVVKDAEGNEVYRNPEAKSTYRKVDTIIEVGPGAPSDVPDAPTTVPADPSPPPTPDPSPSFEPSPDPSPPPEPSPPFEPFPDPSSDPDPSPDPGDDTFTDMEDDSYDL